MDYAEFVLENWPVKGKFQELEKRRGKIGNWVLEAGYWKIEIYYKLFF